MQKIRILIGVATKTGIAKPTQTLTLNIDDGVFCKLNTENAQCIIVEQIKAIVRAAICFANIDLQLGAITDKLNIEQSKKEMLNVPQIRIVRG